MGREDQARAAALHALDTWEQHRSPTDELIAELDAALTDDRDRRFARQLVLGTLRWRLRLDWIIGHFSRPSVAELEPRVLNILRLGILQIHFMDRVPERAAIHTCVELAKRHGARAASGLINAVLRSFQRQPNRVRFPDLTSDTVRYLSLYYSHPEWLVERWRQRWDTEFVRQILETNNTPSPLWLRLNPLRSSAEELCAQIDLDAGPAGYFRARVAHQALHSAAYTAGHFQIQDPSAGLAVTLLAPQPGERVLDACSAPGGKATQIAERMNDTGLVAAADVSATRLQRLRENIARLGLRSVHPVVSDAGQSSLGPFDRVLVDVPCSGTGIIGRHPDARWNRAPEQLADLVQRQRTILSTAYTQLRPGGTLVYSTCSLEREENEDVVEWFLERTPSARIEDAQAYLTTDGSAARYVQTIPGHHSGDGAFAARIHKVNP